MKFRFEHISYTYCIMNQPQSHESHVILYSNCNSARLFLDNNSYLYSEKMRAYEESKLKLIEQHFTRLSRLKDADTLWSRQVLKAANKKIIELNFHHQCTMINLRNK